MPGSGGPSGGGIPVAPVNYVFLETQRIDLLANNQILPGYSSATGAFNGGWIDFQLRDTGYFSIDNQGWLGVQHSGPGTTLSVGHAATTLNNDFVCYQPFVQPYPGTMVDTSQYHGAAFPERQPRAKALTSDPTSSRKGGRLRPPAFFLSSRSRGERSGRAVTLPVPCRVPTAPPRIGREPGTCGRLPTLRECRTLRTVHFFSPPSGRGIF